MATDDLQFDRAEPADGGGPGLTCAACKQPIAGAYFTANGAPVCGRCRDQIAREVTVTASRWPQAIGVGIAAAIGGAVLYFAVAAITGYEIGLVAIAVGWLVGRGIQKATGGRGSRAHQVLAVALTYLSVAGAYFGLAVREMSANRLSAFVGDTATPRPDAPFTADSSTAADSTIEAPAATPPTTPGGRGPSSIPPWLALLGLLFGLPIMSAIGNLPGGLISLFILFIGLSQAWRMTGRLAIDLQGPFQVGPAPGTPA